jgi:hypothetical protein
MIMTGSTKLYINVLTFRFHATLKAMLTISSHLSTQVFIGSDVSVLDGLVESVKLLLSQQPDPEALFLSQRSLLVSQVCSDTRLQKVAVAKAAGQQALCPVGNGSAPLSDQDVEADGGCIDRAFEFTVMSAPLHGVSGPEVNALIMRAVNAGGAGAFLLGSRRPGPILSSGQQRADR